MEKDEKKVEEKVVEKVEEKVEQAVTPYNVINVNIIKRGLIVLSQSIRANMEKIGRTMEVVTSTKTKEMMQNEISGYEALLKEVGAEYENIMRQENGEKR